MLDRPCLAKPNCRNRLDGLVLLRSLDHASIPLVIFDPQYRDVLDKLSYGNEGARQKKRAVLPQMDYSLILDFMSEIARVLKPSGHLFMWCDKYMLCQGKLNHVQIPIVDLVTWKTGRFGMGYRTRRCSEYLLIMQKPPIRAKGVWADHGIRDCWDEKVEVSGHPHRKPMALQAALIAAVTQLGDTVVDPAAGSYSVMDAALSCERNFLGCDSQS